MTHHSATNESSKEIDVPVRERLVETRTNALTAAVMPCAPDTPATRQKQRAIQMTGAAFIKWLMPPLLGLALFIGIWALVSQTSPQLPGPLKTWASA